MSNPSFLFTLSASLFFSPAEFRLGIYVEQIELIPSSHFFAIYRLDQVLET